MRVSSKVREMNQKHNKTFLDAATHFDLSVRMARCVWTQSCGHAEFSDRVRRFFTFLLCECLDVCGTDGMVFTGLVLT